MKTHVKLHEERANYKFLCIMVDSAFEVFAPNQGSIACDIRCKTQRHLDYHIQAFHTPAGIAHKLKSEAQLAAFFKENKIPFDQDWDNEIRSDPTCYKFTQGNVSARLDFHLLVISSILKAFVVFGNDEYCHRRYKCDFERLYNIAASLEALNQNLPLVYIRFNPHFYRKDGVMYDQSLPEAHARILTVLQQLESGEITINPNGVSLIYINYDCTTIDGKLVVNVLQDVEDGTYARYFRDSVVHVVG